MCFPCSAIYSWDIISMCVFFEIRCYNCTFKWSHVYQFGSVRDDVIPDEVVNFQYFCFLVYVNFCWSELHCSIDIVLCTDLQTSPFSKCPLCYTSIHLPSFLLFFWYCQIIIFGYFITLWAGLGGLWETCSPRDPRFAGTNPAEVDGILPTSFGGKGPHLRRPLHQTVS